MNKNKVNSELKAKLEKFADVFKLEIDEAFRALALDDLQDENNKTFMSLFDGLEKTEKREAFIAFREMAKLKSFKIKVKKTDKKPSYHVVKTWSEMNAAERNVVNVRFWRLGEKIDVKIGKSPIKRRAVTPPVAPPVESNGNGGNGVAVVLPEELFGKAPREKTRGLKEVLSALMSRTGWDKKTLLAEITAILG